MLKVSIQNDINTSNDFQCSKSQYNTVLSLTKHILKTLVILSY